MLRILKKENTKEEIFPLFTLAYFVAKSDFALLGGEESLNLSDFDQVKVPIKKCD